MPTYNESRGRVSQRLNPGKACQTKHRVSSGGKAICSVEDAYAREVRTEPAFRISAFSEEESCKTSMLWVTGMMVQSQQSQLNLGMARITRQLVGFVPKSGT